MILYPYKDFNILNEINFGSVRPFWFNKQVKNDGFFNFIEFDYKNDIGFYKTISVDFLILNSKDIKNDNDVNVSDYMLQHGQTFDKIIFICFYERSKGVDRNEKHLMDVDKNVDNSYTKLFQKMQTIINIINFLKDEYEIEWFLFQSAENDPSSGKIKPFNKRNSFYETYLNYYNIQNYFSQYEFEMNYKNISDTIKNFYIVSQRKHVGL